MKRITSLVLILVMLASVFSGCGKKAVAREDEINKTLDAEKDVTLVVAGPWEDCKALETVASAFSEKYPNVTIEYEYIQDYDNLLPERLSADSDKIDLFMTNNIHHESPLLPYALELFSQSDKLDLSETYDGLIKNATFLTADESADKELYSIPLGGEVRGMFVNKTLLASLSLEVPTKLSEFMNCCKVLSENGYIPVQGNPGMFGQHLMYPYICSIIANAEDYESVYDKVNNHEAGISELFREPLQTLYDLTANDYYKYKYVETELLNFTDISNEGHAKSFFSIDDDGSGNFVKSDDVGDVAFMPQTLSLSSTMEKTKEDYHSDIDYEFILSPVSEDGGFAYMSPARGIAVNNKTDNTDWALEFLDYMFIPSVNTTFAEEFGCIPNTTDAFSYISETFSIPENHICQLGQVSFDYDFFSTINTTLIDISKGNNPKYMNDDGNGGKVMYDFDYYLNMLEEHFAEVGSEESDATE